MYVRQTLAVTNALRLKTHVESTLMMSETRTMDTINDNCLLCRRSHREIRTETRENIERMRLCQVIRYSLKINL